MRALFKLTFSAVMFKNVYGSHEPFRKIISENLQQVILEESFYNVTQNSDNSQFSQIRGQRSSHFFYRFSRSGRLPGPKSPSWRRHSTAGRQPAANRPEADMEPCSFSTVISAFPDLLLPLSPQPSEAVLPLHAQINSGSLPAEEAFCRNTNTILKQ